MHLDKSPDRVAATAEGRYSQRMPRRLPASICTSAGWAREEWEELVLRRRSLPKREVAKNEQPNRRPPTCVHSADGDRTPLSRVGPGVSQQFIASQTMSLSASSLRSDYRSLDQSVLPRPHTSSYALPFMVPSNPTSCFALLTLTSSIK